MIKINYVINVPTGLDKIPPASAEGIAFQHKVFDWSLENGLVDFSVDPAVEGGTVRHLSYTWIDQPTLDAFTEHFGQEYVDYYSGFVANIKSVGGTVERTTEEV